jgi:hypothetical protein
MEYTTPSQPTEPPVRNGALEAERVAEARRRVAAIKGFYIHFAIFALVLVGLFAINAASGRTWWVQWVLVGWGIGVVAHAVAVFSRASQAVAAWEERKVRELASERR